MAANSEAVQSIEEMRESFVTTTELVAEAQRRLEPQLWDYIAGGTESETSLKRNRQALDRLALRPRVMRDVSHTDLSVSFLGQKMRLPILLAPIGGLQTIRPEGAALPARACRDFGVMYMQSSVSDPSLEEVSSAAGDFWSFQLYVFGGFDVIEEYVRRAEDLGAKGFCVTVDSDAYSRRERNLVNRYNARQGTGTAGRDPTWRERFSWDTFDKMRRLSDVPMMLKGIMRPEDARLCVEHGVDVIYISNHGGRQLDHGQGTLEVLPEIVDAVGGRARIAIDGGFMRGTDIIKALILGADIVGIGKLQGMALGAAGEAGVLRMLEILEEEMMIDMKLLGVNSFEEFDGSYLCEAIPTDEPSALSTFPLLKDRSAKDK